MTLDSFDAVFYTVGFLVPGFVWSAVLSMLVPRRTQGTEVKLLECLTLSCLNHGLWFALLIYIFRGGLFERSPGWSILWLWVILFVSPVGFGVLTATLAQKPWVARLLARFGFRLKHVSPTAWDYQFAKGQRAWVIVTLKDRSRIYGLYGYDSFAGDDPDRRDLFLEAVYVPVDGGVWKKEDKTGGIMIAADEISAVEFLSMVECSNEQQAAAN